MLNIVSRILSVHKEHELLAKLEVAGLGDSEAQLVIESKGNELAKKVVDFIRRGGYVASATYQRAREIMSKNFLGIEEAIQHFKVKLTFEAAEAFERIPFSEDVLMSCKDTHILVADFGLSLLEVRKRVDQKLFYAQDWYNSEKFAKLTDKPQWRLLRKTAVPDSFNKNWQEQQALLTKDEETPKARAMAYMIMLYYAETSERLFQDIYVRCSDLASYGLRVFLGDFDSLGLRVARYWDDYRSYYIGLASSRKF